MKEVDSPKDMVLEKQIEEEVRSMKALVQTFLQTVKAYRLYEPDHPILLKFLDRLRNDFNHYFDEYDSFSLQVGEHQLFCRGKVVYENRDVKESLAFAFFKDGIREIRFFKGLALKELAGFLNVMRKNDLVSHLEDDLVTLLWEKDFSHITFETADEFLEEGGLFVPAKEEDLMQRLEWQASAEGFEGRDGGATEEELNVLTSGEVQRALNPSPGQSLIEACQLTPHEKEKITQEVELEKQPGFLHVLNVNLIEILLHLGDDMDAYENMIAYLEGHIESLLQKKEVAKAVAILKKLSDTVESIALKDRQILAIRRILESSSRPSCIELIVKTMKGDGEVNSELIQRYMEFLTKQAVEPLCLLLGDVGLGNWRKVVSDTLVRLSREDIHPLMKFLSDENPALVCDVLHILGKVEYPDTVKYLGSLVSHKDQKVREATLQLLTQFEGKGLGLIRKFLKDRAVEIRMKAALIFARMAKDQAVKPLLEIILSKDFYKRNYSEKRIFLTALGETATEEAILALKKIGKKRSWFKGAKWKEMRLCAIQILKKAATDTATSRAKPICLSMLSGL